MLKTSAFGLGFQHLPWDLANVNAWKTMFDPYIDATIWRWFNADSMLCFCWVIAKAKLKHSAEPFPKIFRSLWPFGLWILATPYVLGKACGEWVMLLLLRLTFPGSKQVAYLLLGWRSVSGICPKGIRTRDLPCHNRAHQFLILHDLFEYIGHWWFCWKSNDFCLWIL